MDLDRIVEDGFDEFVGGTIFECDRAAVAFVLIAGCGRIEREELAAMCASIDNQVVTGFGGGTEADFEGAGGSDDGD